MRIISGIFKGRVVKMPKSNLVRPTTDRNKESL
ncbi:MAG: 16S rRNA (guanine(966)-N(2))-methyltransferase RsmD, partial [Melioribacteraceae bacterium]